jgi:hypothetical protein
MIEVQRAVYLRMAQDAELLKLLGLASSADESEISKRILPNPPGSDIQETESLVLFRFPPTRLLSSALFEKRPVQFRIWSSDASLITQQKISQRLQEIFVGEEIAISEMKQYSEFFYAYESQISGILFGKWGWILELELHSHVVKP